MTNALAIREDMPLQELGNVLARSGFFQDTKDVSQAIVKVLAGRELGFGPVASMTGVNIIKGRVSLSANLMAAAVKRSGRYDYRVLSLDDKHCEIAFFEVFNGKREEIGRSTFSADDAKTAGLNGDNWSKYKRNMFFARAMSNGVKWYCADVFGGPLYTPDELGAIVDGETGEVIDLKATEVSSPVQAPAPATTNGNGHKPAPADSAPMTLEEAENVTSSEGVRYGEIDTEKLTFMANAIANAKTHKPEHDTKLTAIQIILKARSEATGQS